jgi:branched-chain amino acid transport system substrate-binding protein
LGTGDTAFSLKGEPMIKQTRTSLGVLGTAVLIGLILVAPALAQNEIFIPLLVYRTGPYAPNGIPIANGYVDYLKLLNTRDNGINGIKVVWEECETKYDTKLGRGVL